jgi:hypothetical protein
MRPTVARMKYLFNELRRAIASGSAVIWIGAGISASLSGNHPTATWWGLLQAAITRCLDLRHVSVDDAAQLRAALQTGTEGFLHVATTVERVLRKAREWERFWSDFGRSLPLANPAVGHAIASLGCPLISTNYDRLLEQATGRSSVSCRHFEQVERALRGEVADVIHVHGIVDEPDAIVFGSDSYAAHLANDRAMATLRAIHIFKSHIYIGFGEGLDDPFFTAHREWLRTTFPSTAVRHFRLCLESQVVALDGRHRDDNVSIVAYGRRHQDLVRFLHRCRPRQIDSSRRGRIGIAASLAVFVALTAPAAVGERGNVEIVGRVLAGGLPIPFALVRFPGTDSAWHVHADGTFGGVARVRRALGPATVTFGEEQIPIDVSLPDFARTVTVELDLQTQTATVNAK